MPSFGLVWAKTANFALQIWKYKFLFLFLCVSSLTTPTLLHNFMLCYVYEMQCSILNITLN